MELDASGRGVERVAGQLLCGASIKSHSPCGLAAEGFCSSARATRQVTLQPCSELFSSLEPCCKSSYASLMNKSSDMSVLYNHLVDSLP